MTSAAIDEAPVVATELLRICDDSVGAENLPEVIHIRVYQAAEARVALCRRRGMGEASHGGWRDPPPAAACGCAAKGCSGGASRSGGG